MHENQSYHDAVVPPAALLLLLSVILQIPLSNPAGNTELEKRVIQSLALILVGLDAIIESEYLYVMMIILLNMIVINVVRLHIDSCHHHHPTCSSLCCHYEIHLRLHMSEASEVKGKGR